MKRAVAGLFLKVWHLTATAVFLTLVVSATKIATATGLRRFSHTPRVVFGASPLINSKYHSQALNFVDVPSTTVVRGYMSATTAQDFDRVFGIITKDTPRWKRWYTYFLDVYITFTRLLWQRDVFFYYFDGFYLRQGGPLQWLEVPVLKWLGKRVVVMPYGGDMTTGQDIRGLVRKYANVRQYPVFATNDALIHRQIHHLTKRADAIIGGGAIGPGHLPRIDYLCASFFAIDEGEWAPTYGPARRAGEVFRVLHAPNHRHIKGTKFLLDAIAQLKQEGLNIELVLLEGVPNTEVRRFMAECHALAEQFIQGWHGLNGLEGMASGKPVLCYLDEELKHLYSLYSFGGDCPIVNTPIEKIADNLRWLYHHPEVCEELGRKGRAYVEQYHSLDAMGGFLKGVVYQVWAGVPFDAEEYWRGRRAMAVPAEGARQPAEQRITAVDG